MHFAIALPRQAIVNSEFSGWYEPPPGEAAQRYAHPSLCAPASCIASSMRSATVVPSDTWPVQVEPTRSAPTSGGPATAKPIGAPLPPIPFGLRVVREIPLG